MRVIYKYDLTVLKEQIIKIRGNILSVVEQNDNIVLHTITNPEWNEIEYSIRIHGTGHELDDSIMNYKFLDTVSLHGGRLMLHVFAKPMP